MNFLYLAFHLKRNILLKALSTAFFIVWLLFTDFP